MKQKLTLALTLLILIAMAGCEFLRVEGPVLVAPPESEGPILTSQEAELYIWASSDREAEFIEVAAREFNRRFPNITARVGVHRDAASRVERSPEEAADLISLPHLEIRALADALHILPARDQARVREAAFPGAAEAATVNGVVFGYPVSVETVALFYNRSHVQQSELPETWGELIALANTLDVQGFAASPSAITTSATFISRNGNRPFGNFGEGEEHNLLTDEAVSGMGTLRALGGVSGLSSAELPEAAAAEIFANGNAAFFIGGTWNIAGLRGVNFGVAPLPRFQLAVYDEHGYVIEPEIASASLAYANIMAVSAHSFWPDEASAFADMLLEEEMQRARLEITGEIPSVFIRADSPAYANGFLEQMQNSFALSTASSAARFWNAFGETAARIWDGGNIENELTELTLQLDDLVS